MTDLLSRANVDIAINTLLDDLQPNDAIQPSDHNGLLGSILDTLANGLSTTLRTGNTTGGFAIDITDGDNIKYNKGGSYVGVLDSLTLTGSRSWDFPDNSGTIALLSDITGGDNIASANLTFNGSYYADLNGNDWEVKNGLTGSAFKLESTVSGKAKFYTNGEVVNSAANFAWDGQSNVGLSVTQSGNIIHAWSSQNYKLYTSNGSISLFEVGVTSGASRLDLKLTNGTSFFKIISNADSYLHSNFLVKGSNNAVGTSGFKVTDIYNNSLLDVKNNGRFATNGSNVNSAFNVAYDGTSANAFTVSGGNAIQHALNGQSYTIRNTAGTQDLLKFNVQSAVSKFILTTTSNTEFFRISNDANSFLSTNLTLGQSAPVTGARFLIRNYGTNASQQSFFGNITMNTAGRVGSSGSFGTAQKGFECFDTTANKKFVWSGTAWEQIISNTNAGFTGTGNYTNFTIVGGIITNAT